MKYTDLSPDEIRLNIIEPLANTIISIAHANSDFVCTECLRTLERLEDVLGCLDDEVASETVAEADDILNV